MRCPRCGIKQKQKKITGMRCSCGYRFTFHPRTAHGMTDERFLCLIRQAGDNGRCCFTFPQLYGAWCRQKDKERRFRLSVRLAAAGAVLSAVTVLLFFLFGWPAALPATLLPVVVLWWLIRTYRRRMPPDLDALKKMVRRWHEENGVPDMMLVQPSLDEPPLDFPEKDIFDYGVERIIITERPLLVDLLVKNGFHADQKALVFCRNGYPRSISRKAKNLLAENAALPVYLLHDATETGRVMHRKIKLPGRPVIDLGIKPEHLEKLSCLTPLQLHRKEYKGPLDIIPYPVLAALCAAAMMENIPLEDVLDRWAAERKEKKPFADRVDVMFDRVSAAPGRFFGSRKNSEEI
ncbi:MAG: hypothetical protein ACL93V_11425 [Candidatus Electrothrix sp. YB6]